MTPRSLLLTLVTLPAALVPAALPAQAGTYTLQRDGCNGTPRTQCLAQNHTPPLQLAYLSQPSDYAFPLVNTSSQSILVLGFDFWTSSITGSPETVTSHLYQDASGPGAQTATVPTATAVANGTITVGGFNTWWSTSVFPPPVLLPGEVFWVGFNARTRIAPPLNANGTYSVAQAVHRQTNVSGNAWLPLTAGGYAAIRVRCTDPSYEVTTLQNLDQPRLGQPFRLTVSPGLPFTPGFVVWSLGSSTWSGLPLPYDLASFGAPSCFVHTSTDFSVFVLTDALGTATLTANMPPAGFVGLQFFNQGVLTTSRNSLGLLTTNMGRGVLGT